MSQHAKVPEPKVSEAKVPEAKIPEPSIDEILASIRRSIVPDDEVAREGSKPATARKPASRKPGPAPAGAVAKGNRPDDAAQIGFDPVRGQGKDDMTDRGTGDAPDGGFSVGGSAALLKEEARIAEGDTGQGDTRQGDTRQGDTRQGDMDNSNPAQAGTPVIPFTGTRETGSSDQDGPLLSPRTTAAVDTAFTSLAHTMLSQNPRTLEDLVREMLRPMLKTWLDANLPDTVERLVRAEIERVSRRG